MRVSKRVRLSLLSCLSIFFLFQVAQVESAYADMASQIFVRTRVRAPSDPCATEHSATLLVILENQTMYLCDQRRTVGQYPISIGSGGYYKSQDGDRKTPVGIYQLAPRQSPGYGSVLAVGYPNADQLYTRYPSTGNQILIHGPSLNMQKDFADFRMHLVSVLGAVQGESVYAQAMSRIQRYGLTSVNWTAGCFAVATASDLAVIRSFANANPGAKLVVAVQF